MLKKFHAKIGIFKYVLPTYVIHVCELLIKEANNYLFYRKNLKRIENDGILRNYKINLEKDLMCFAINLKPEFLLLTASEIAQSEQLIVSNEIIKIENILSRYELYDLLKFTYERIHTEDFYAYGVVCGFNFRQWNPKNLWYVSIYTIILGLSIFLIFH